MGLLVMFSLAIATPPVPGGAFPQGPAPTADAGFPQMLLQQIQSSPGDSTGMAAAVPASPLSGWGFPAAPGPESVLTSLLTQSEGSGPDGVEVEENVLYGANLPEALGDAATVPAKQGGSNDGPRRQTSVQPGGQSRSQAAAGGEEQEAPPDTGELRERTPSNEAGLVAAAIPAFLTGVASGARTWTLNPGFASRAALVPGAPAAESAGPDSAVTEGHAVQDGPALDLPGSAAPSQAAGWGEVMERYEGARPGPFTGREPQDQERQPSALTPTNEAAPALVPAPAPPTAAPSATAVSESAASGPGSSEVVSQQGGPPSGLPLAAGAASSDRRQGLTPILNVRLRPAASNPQEARGGSANRPGPAPFDTPPSAAGFQVSRPDANRPPDAHPFENAGEPAGRNPGSRIKFEPAVDASPRPDQPETAVATEPVTLESPAGPSPEPAVIGLREAPAARAASPTTPHEAPRPPLSPSEQLADAASPAPPAKPPAAVRQVELDLAPDPNREVMVTLRERAGNVEVEVRAQDPLMRQHLQSEVGELVGKLERAGYEVDVAARAAQDLPFDAAGGHGRGNPRQPDQRAPQPGRRASRPAEWNQILEQTTWQTQ